MKFANRVEAGKMLSIELREFKNQNVIVVALPRGGVPVAASISNELNAPLELFFSKKIGHPDNEEFAIGAVTKDSYSLNEEYQYLFPDYIKSEIERLQKEIKNKIEKFGGNSDPSNKTIILVDDGVATGRTIALAADYFKKQKAKSVIIAVPVSPYDSLHQLKKKVDAVICLYVPDDFSGIGQFYENFDQLTDEEMRSYLK